jgi:hypothetical protein
MSVFVSEGRMCKRNEIEAMTNGCIMKKFFQVSVTLFGSVACSLSTSGAKPYAFTQPHWAVTSTLNGMAGPNGLPSTAWFEWGVTTNYGQTTAPVAVGASSGVVKQSAVLSNLVAGQIYHARLVVSNSAGVALGADQPLITVGSAKVAILGTEYPCCVPFPLPIPKPPCLPPPACNDGHGGDIRIGTSNIVAVAAGGLVLRSDGAVVDLSSAEVSGFTNVVAIADRPFGTVLALRADGTVIGDDRNVPSGLSNVVAIAQGSSHGLALRGDGTVVAWGEHNGLPQTDVPAGLSNVVAVAVGYSHSLALRIEGTVVAWGWNGDGRTNVPAGLSNVVAVAAGIDQSMALRRDGTVVVWPDLQTNLPPALSNVVAITAGGTSFALRRDGTVIQWARGQPSQVFYQQYFTNIAAIAASECSVALALGPNQAPWAFPEKWRGPQNSEVVVELHASDANSDFFNVRITALPASGTLYQFENSARGAAIAAPQTAVIDPNRRVIFAPATDADDLEASFSFTANDGELDSPPATVGISLTPLFPRIKMDRWAPCGATVQFVGDTNKTYRVWGSTNLSDWQVLGTAWLGSPNWLGSPAAFGFTDGATGLPARFYKVSTP